MKVKPSVIMMLIATICTFSCEDNDEKIEISLIQVSPGSATISIGETQQFTATPRDNDGNEIDIDVNWFSDNDSVAEVDDNGLAVGISAGGVGIFAMKEGIIGGAALIVMAHPLVGTWDFTNMEQSSVYLAAENIPIFGLAEGDTIWAGSVGWAEFSALGVNAEVIIQVDGNFLLEGDLPVANDTLGFTPDIIHLVDTGIWEHDETAGTFILDGELYDFGGLLTLDDPDNPTIMTLAYVEMYTNLEKVLQFSGYFYDVLLHEYSYTILELTKQP